MTCRQESGCETRDINTSQHTSLSTQIANPPLSDHAVRAETYIASCFNSWDTCSVAWGSYSRTTRTRENQDGWLVLRNVPDAQQNNKGTPPQTKPCRLQWDDASGSYLYPGLPSECSPLKKRCTADFSSSQHNGNAISPQSNSLFSQFQAPTLLPCFPEAVTPVVSRKNSPLFPLGSLNRKVALLSLIGNNDVLYDQEKTIASSNASSVSHEVQYLGDSQIPLIKTPAALGGCPLQDSQGSTPLSTKKLLTRTETCPALSTETSTASPWVFAVFDGHGSKGRIAAHLASKTLAQFLSKTQLNSNEEDVFDKKFPVLEPKQNPIPSVLNRTKCKLEEAFNAMQQAILESNVFHKQDFGTTAVVVASLGRYLVTATCGDSSAFLIVGAPRLSGDQTPSQRTVINVQMSVDHSLRSSAEIERLRKHTKGRVVFGAGDVLRLIPASKTYPEARAEGLAINMARSLGHVILSQCGLSPQPSFTLLDIADIFELLFQQWKNTTSLRSETQLLTPAQSTANGFKHREWLAPVLFFQAGMFDHTLQKKFPTNPLASQETASTRAMTTEVSQSDASDCETSCFEHLEHTDPVALLPQSVVVAESSLPSNAMTDRKSEAAPLNKLQSETLTSTAVVTQTSVNNKTCPSSSNPELATKDDEVDNVIVVVEHYEDGNSSKQNEETELMASNNSNNNATHNSVFQTEKSKQHILKSEIRNLGVPDQQKTSVAESKGRKPRHHWIPSKKPTQQICDEKKKKQTPQYDGAAADTLPRASQQQVLDGKPRSDTKQTTTYGRGAFFNRLFGCVTKGDAPGKSQQLPHLMESKKREQQQQTTDHCGNTRHSETLSKTYAATGQINQSRASQQKQKNQRSHHSVQTEWAQSEAHGNVPTTEQMRIPAKKTGLYKYGFIQDMKKEAIQLNSKSDNNVPLSSAVDPSAGRSNAVGKPMQPKSTSKVDNSAGHCKQSEHIFHKDCSYKMGTDEARLSEPGIINNTDKVQNLEAAAAITHLIEKSSVFLVLVSDGISDVIPSQAIADYVLDHDLLGWDPLKIATMLTMKASTIRGDLQVRADNCTALVVKLQAENVKPPSFNDMSK